ncbi:uncharacterized protein METZ01_LOCUS511463, partial [marine metagenome]
VKTIRQSGPAKSLGFWAALVFCLVVVPVEAVLVQVTQTSEPAGFVSQTDAIEEGAVHASVSPSLTSNGYVFG